MEENQDRAKVQHRFPAERCHVLKDEERRRWLPPEPVLQAAGIPAGVTVIDVGAGTGFWTGPLSKAVGPSGKVIAADVEPVMLDELRALAQAEGLTNVEVVQSEEFRIPLDDHVADAVVLGFVLHEPSNPPALLHEVTRLLRPGGRILVIDWHKRPMEKGPPIEHRLSEEETREMLRSEEFAVETLAAPNPDFYILLARRT